MEHALATGLYTTGAGQSSTMLVTELGPSLAMLGPLHQELSNLRLTPQLGGLVAHAGTTKLRRNTKAGEHILYEWTRTGISDSRPVPRVELLCPTFTNAHHAPDP